MGYTHYWTVSGFNTAQWAEFQACARAVFRRAAARKIRLRGSFGVGRVDYFPNAIQFNGDAAAGEAHETCSIKRGDFDRDFCKTAHHPYDAAVVALLTIGARMGCLEWSSDGDLPDHEDGAALAAMLPTSDWVCSGVAI